jgi:hypothetical protein
MISFSGSLKIFLLVDCCEMRKGFNGLYGLGLNFMVAAIDRFGAELQPVKRRKLAQKYTSPIAGKISATKVRHDFAAS